MATLPFDMEIEDIAALAAIIKKNDLEELRLTDEELRMKLVIKGSGGRPHHAPPPPPPHMQNPPPPPQPQVIVVPMGGSATAAQTAASETPAGDSGVDTPSAPPVPKENGVTVKAPVVGTYYAAPAPGKPPFVTVGQRIKKGDVIMIIETMKLMNEIQSDVDGVVEKILVKDGQAVEYDQPIMIVNS
ncbi:MAG: biotin/lipoyl-binding protein [Ruminococcus sp.]|nr:biotin/lipoyl-binding protein [Ruminococcus sp.]